MPGPRKLSASGFPTFPAVSQLATMLTTRCAMPTKLSRLYAEAETREGRSLPKPRTISALKSDPSVVPDLRDHMVALIALDQRTFHAAE
jgi:hypothetical protein